MPKSYKPLPRDIFTSDDFYADKELWSDPRYFRCNSPQATEYQRGVLSRPGVNTSDKIEDAPWGHCEIELSARGHREPVRLQDGAGALRGAVKPRRRNAAARASIRSRTFRTPSGTACTSVRRPRCRATQMNWYWGRHTQIPTVLSVLTPKYQEWMVQEAYHQVRGNAIWPSTFCWPEGFMRRWYPAAVWEHYVIATPDLVHVRAGVARNFIQDIYVGREFNMEDVRERRRAAPRRRGAALVRRDDRLLGQGRADHLDEQHPGLEVALGVRVLEQDAVDRDLHADPREGGKFIGLNHETILYDEEALAEPVRIVRNLHKINSSPTTNEVPYPFIECVQTIFNVDGAQRAAHAGHQDRVRDARHVRPAVGEDLGRELRARHDQARRRPRTCSTSTRLCRERRWAAPSAHRRTLAAEVAADLPDMFRPAG